MRDAAVSRATTPLDESGREIIHLVGPDITFGTVRRQRCVWCGALVDEYDLALVAAPIEYDAEGKVIPWDGPAPWGGLVAVDGNVKWAVDDPTDGKAPPRSCMVLLPDMPS